MQVRSKQQENCVAQSLFDKETFQINPNPNPIARKSIKTSIRFEAAASSSVDKKQLQTGRQCAVYSCFLSRTDEEAAASKRMEVLILFRAVMNIY